MRKIAVMLSGCGFKDGAEITEAVSTYIALGELNVEFKSFAINKDFKSVNHITDDEEDTRNVLTESSRITRGDVESLDMLNPNEFDAIIFPGGFGVAKHFCEFAALGSKASVKPEIKTLIEKFHSQSKPIGAFCISPALIALVLGSHNVAVTIGNDQDVAQEIEKTGAQHIECEVTDYITDRENKVITTPAYMYDSAKPFEVFKGIQSAIKEIVEMA